MKSEEKQILRDITKIDSGISYRYVLSVKKSRKVTSFSLPLYSIEAFMTKEQKTTSHLLEDVFADGGKAIVFFEMLVNGLASPIDLPYILEDKLTV